MSFIEIFQGQLLPRGSVELDRKRQILFEFRYLFLIIFFNYSLRLMYRSYDFVLAYIIENHAVLRILNIFPRSSRSLGLI
ncbi:hypothetical protein GCM10025861_27440 [Methanobacterium petrolearium]|nr:hypothetical protein GCM10025861_00020 [Methanobacterium petrolearium]BDZ72227.1 hypothetical protein GCM10025861_27440 [Methanobacterium petrolearium]